MQAGVPVLSPVSRFDAFLTEEDIISGRKGRNPLSFVETDVD